MRTPFRSFIRADIAILVEDAAPAKEGVWGIYFPGAIRQLRLRAELRFDLQPLGLPEMREIRGRRHRRARLRARPSRPDRGGEDPLRLSRLRSPADRKLQ